MQQITDIQRVYFFKGFFCFSAWGSFPCYLLHFGAKICVLHAFWSQNLPFACPLGFWLLAFGFGFTWLMAHGFWHLVLVSLGFGFGRSLHLALGVCWVLVLQFAYNISCNALHIYIIFHVNCTKTTDIEYRSLYACCCKKIAKPSIRKPKETLNNTLKKPSNKP